MIRLGLIGCGGMSRSFVQRFNAIGPRVQMAATVDVDRARAEEAGQAFGAKIATDYREILDDVDAALLVLPHHLHHAVTLDCLAAGKHVLVEKPLANTEQECLEMIAAAERADRVLMVAYVMRYHPLVLKLKEVLDSGEFGPCFHMSIWTEQFTRPVDKGWACQANTLGGGQLFSHGCHYIDLMLWMLGRPVEGTHLGTNRCTPWMEMEGSSDVALKFESGTTAYHFGTWGARGTKLGYAIHAHCEQGMLEVDFASGQLRLHQFKLDSDMIEPHIEEGTTEDDRGRVTVLHDVGASGKYTDRELVHFLDCIENGTQPETDGPRSLQSLRVIWRLYEAERQRKVADLTGLGLDEVSLEPHTPASSMA